MIVTIIILSAMLCVVSGIASIFAIMGVGAVTALKISAGWMAVSIVFAMFIWPYLLWPKN